MKKEIILSNLNLIGYESSSEDKLYHFINDLNPIYINSFDDHLSLIREIKINKLFKRQIDINIVIDYQNIITSKIKDTISFRNYINDIKEIMKDCKYTITIISSIYIDFTGYKIKKDNKDVRYKFRTPESILYMAKTAYQIIDNKIFVVKQHIKNEN